MVRGELIADVVAVIGSIDIVLGDVDMIEPECGFRMTLQAETRTAIERARDRYPLARSAILPALWAVQHEQGLITPDAMSEIAGILQVTPSEVEAVSTFYSMYFQHPHGRHEVIVCINVSCALRGADEIVDHLERSLGCASGETTADGDSPGQAPSNASAAAAAPQRCRWTTTFRRTSLRIGWTRSSERLRTVRTAATAHDAGPVAAGTPRAVAARSAPAACPRDAGPAAAARAPAGQTRV